MPIYRDAYNETIERYTEIRVSYAVGDAKGGSFDNPWTMQDIIDLAESENWDIKPQKAENSYFINYRLWILSSAYFEINNETVEFFDAATASMSQFISVFRSQGNLKITKSQLIIPYNRPLIQGFYTIADSTLRCSWLDAGGGDSEIRNNIARTYIGDNRTARLSGHTDVKSCLLNSLGTAVELAGGNMDIVYEDCIIPTASAVLFNYSATITLKKLFFNNTNGHLSGNVRLGNGVITFLDCRFPINRNVYLNTDTTEATQEVYYNQTVRFFGDEGVTIKIYDKDNSLVKSIVKESSVLEDVLTMTYVKWFSPDTSPYTVIETEEVYEPYRFVISKQGYETQEITDVYLSEENPMNAAFRVGKVAPTDFVINLKKQVPLMIDENGNNHVKVNPENVGDNREFLI